MSRDQRERERSEEMMRDSLAVFVFGSNRRGVHGGGAAYIAQRRYGAKRGVGEGRCGRSYAIPTKETWREAGLPLPEIAVHVERFLVHAREKWAAVFVVTTSRRCTNAPRNATMTFGGDAACTRDPRAAAVA